MRRSFTYTFCSLALAVALLSCSHTPLLADGSPRPAATQQGQQLPVTAIATMGGQVIQLEVTRTPEEQALGLMFRTELADDRGMLFSFEPPRPVQFWMRNTLIPLDMVFLLNGEIKAIATDVPPCTTPTCPLYGPNTNVNQVIELRGGRATELGLAVGDRVQIAPVSAAP